MRTLASIQRITDIQPIPDADAIEVASVLGWKVVVKKGEFAVGDLAVYLEIDSVPPDEEQYRFLWKFADERPNNFRIRTIKLRGQISQGILFKIDQEIDLKTGDVVGGFVWGKGLYVAEGDDVSDALGVTKYEPPLPNGSNDIAGQFFDGVPKTDEERVQSSTGARHLANLRGRPYYITVKCDGSSMTVAEHDGKVRVASLNYRLADNPDSAYWQAARFSGLIDFVEANPHLAVQGELVGPGVQGNKMECYAPMCAVFNIYDRNEGRYWSLAEMIASGLPLVPIVEVGHLFNYDQEQLLALAEGKYDGTKNEREGIVIRSNDSGERISFKAISNRFLLKGGE